jgi:hypothetical protein
MGRIKNTVDDTDVIRKDIIKYIFWKIVFWALNKLFCICKNLYV